MAGLNPRTGEPTEEMADTPKTLDPREADTTVPPARSGVNHSIPIPRSAPLPDLGENKTG